MKNTHFLILRFRLLADEWIFYRTVTEQERKNVHSCSRNRSMVKHGSDRGLNCSMWAERHAVVISCLHDRSYRDVKISPQPRGVGFYLNST